MQSGPVKSSRLNNMPTSGIMEPAPHHYSPLPDKPLTGLPYVRNYFYIPEVISLVGVGLCSLGMAVYLSQGDAGKNKAQWQPHTQPWLQTPNERTPRSSAGGVKEMIQRELRK
ncbi:unnamed protein product [Rhizoctonia solani]|uniref:Uncharacterized protein n=1 Tax=Rhizoctonia solani TaxID=456999 RepID=A0A8H3GGX3_9AGAM|nr:unnamed protein product [Rhizoctonia solani]